MCNTMWSVHGEIVCMVLGDHKRGVKPARGSQGRLPVEGKYTENQLCAGHCVRCRGKGSVRNSSGFCNANYPLDRTKNMPGKKHYVAIMLSRSFLFFSPFKCSFS